MSKTLQAPHWIPYHRDDKDIVFFGRWQPRYVKIVMDGIDPPYLEDIPENAAVILRHYPSSELYGQRGFAGYTSFAQPMTVEMESVEAYYGTQGSAKDEFTGKLYRDTSGSVAETKEAVVSAALTPEEAAVQHIEVSRQIAERIRARGYPLDRFWFEGLNEPMLWSIEPPEAVARYERKRISEANRYGLNLTVLNCGVGWPGNGGVQNAPVQWDWARPMFEVWKPNHILGLHEYCGLNGPGENYRWWMGRYLQCPYQVNIVMTETGLDAGVVPGMAGKGWWDLPPTSVREKARQYIGMMNWYETECLKDPRVRGLCIFTYDGVGEHWGHFNIKVSDWQEEFLAWLAPRPELPDNGAEPSSFNQALQLACTEHQCIQLNPGAAIQKQLVIDGFTPTSGEFDFTYAGVAYIAQRAERMSDGAVRGYFAPRSNFNAVAWIKLVA